jgi:hypothetical protein
MTDSQRNKGGRPKTDVALMATRLAQDIDVAALDPGLAVTKAAVVQRTGIPKSTLDLYAEEPRIAALLTRLDDLQKARLAAKALVAQSARRIPDTARPSMRTAVAPSELVSLDDHQMAQRYAQATQKASWAAQRLAARFRRVEHVSDLPAATYHLELAVQQLHGVLADLRPLAQEWVRRRGGLPAPLPEQHELLPDHQSSPDGS